MKTIIRPENGVSGVGMATIGNFWCVTALTLIWLNIRPAKNFAFVEVVAPYATPNVMRVNSNNMNIKRIFAALALGIVLVSTGCSSKSNLAVAERRVSMLNEEMRAGLHNRVDNFRERAERATAGRSY